jgi:hypothetical protein
MRRLALPAVAEQGFDIQVNAPNRGQSGIHPKQFQEGIIAPLELQISPPKMPVFVEN